MITTVCAHILMNIILNAVKNLFRKNPSCPAVRSKEISTEVFSCKIDLIDMLTFFNFMIQFTSLLYIIISALKWVIILAKSNSFSDINVLLSLLYQKPHLAQSLSTDIACMQSLTQNILEMRHLMLMMGIIKQDSIQRTKQVSGLWLMITYFVKQFQFYRRWRMDDTKRTRQGII